MGEVHIAVLTFTDDLHALAIQAHLRTIPGTVCDVVEVDTIADRVPGVSWSTEADDLPADRADPGRSPSRPRALRRHLVSPLEPAAGGGRFPGRSGRGRRRQREYVERRARHPADRLPRSVGE